MGAEGLEGWQRVYPVLPRARTLVLAVLVQLHKYITFVLWLVGFLPQKFLP